MLRPAIALGLVLAPLAAAAQIFRLETGLENRQSEISFFSGSVDIDGLITLTIAVTAIALIWSNDLNTRSRLKAKALLSLGIGVLAINIAFGELWDPVTLHNAIIDDVEDLLEAVGMLIIAISAGVNCCSAEKA
jgi:hypothetical protein